MLIMVIIISMENPNIDEKITVTFCGHRDAYGSEIPQRLYFCLDVICKQAVLSGQEVVFLCGGYGNFDSTVSLTIDKIRKAFPTLSISKVFVTPYITESYKERNEQMRSYYDEIVFPPIETVPIKFAIPERNKWMVNESDIVVAYVTHGWGGAATTLRFAQRKGKQIYYIND